MILAGDVGGTKTVLGLFEPEGADLRCVSDERFACADYPSLDALLADFLERAGNPTIETACIGVAGIVERGRCNATNLPWVVSESDLARVSGAARVRLLNDLEASAIGMSFLPQDQLCVLQEGSDPARAGHIAVISAGTGLGQAVLYHDGQAHHPMASEGGHASFAPADALQTELLQWLRARHGDHVPVERALSGPGYVELYRFLRERSGKPEPALLAEVIDTPNAGAEITRLARDGTDPVCVQTLELFVELYGAEAGNLALRALPRGGVLIGGGIAPQIVSELQTARFLEAFAGKGFMEPFLRSLRVAVVLESDTALLGAARYAASL